MDDKRDDRELEMDPLEPPKVRPEDAEDEGDARVAREPTAPSGKGRATDDDDE